MLDRRGLTLMELVLILLVIAALIMILLPSMNCSRCQAKKTQCAANLKGMGATMLLYAAQWRDRLPVAGDGAGTTWLCDQTVGFRDLFIGGAMKEPATVDTPAVKALYCPNNAGEISLDRWTHGAVSVWGYALFNERGERAGLSALPGRTMPPLMYWKKTTDMAYPTDQELAMDKIVSDKVGVGAKFEGVVGGALPEMTYSTNHVAKGAALGANVLCGDGHVGYRKFPTDAANPANAVAIKQSGGREAYFWVVNP